MTPKVFDDRPCHLGEGPLWHPERQRLFWFDINGKCLRTAGQEWRFDRQISAAGWIDTDTLLIATESDLIQFDLTNGAQDSIAPLEADNPLTRSNDGRADPWGGFWIGTMGKNAGSEMGAIYRYYRGELRQLFPRITITNAICFTPDATHAYFADTARGLVWRQALNDADGWPRGAPDTFLDHGSDGPNPDGAVVDAAGNFWCAEWGSARVRCYAPDGSVLHEITLPVSQPSCPAFGGRDLYVTTAQQGLGQTALAAEPLAGQVFVIRDVALGQSEHQVIL